MTPGIRDFFLNLYVSSSVLNVLTCAAIIPLVLTRNRHSLVVRLFCAFIAEAGAWSFFYLLWILSATRALAEFEVRTVMLVVCLMPASFLHFISEIAERPLPRWLHVVNYLLGFAFATTVYQPRFAPYGGPSFLVFPVWPLAGPLYPFQVAHFVLAFSWAFAILYRTMQQSAGVVKTRTQIIFWGTLLSMITGVTNYLPWFAVYLPPIFPPFVSMIVLAFAYAIVRHQLMEIEVVIKRTLVFAGLVGLVVVIVSLVAFVSQDVLARMVRLPKFWSNLLAAMIIAASYGRVRSWLVDATDRYLFQRRYDYRELLQTFTDEVMSIMNLQQLVDNTVRTLAETVKLTSCSLLLLNKDARRYEVVASSGAKPPMIAVEPHEPLIKLLQATSQPIRTNSEPDQRSLPEVVRRWLVQLHAELCLPLHVHDELKGMLCLGKKKSDEPFTNDDLAILLPLSQTLGIAIANAQLFDDLAKTQVQAAQKEKLAVIGTLSAGINHEIRNPLAIVKAQCETFVLDWHQGMLKSQPQEQILERCLAIMQGAVHHIDRATAITQKLSSFAKPIKERLTQSVSVLGEMEEVLTLVGYDLRLEKIAIHKDIPPDLPSIRVDRRQFQEVLFNLIRNAGQAIRPPGTITIRARHHNGQVEIEIVDTGTGIPSDQLDKIYDPFFTTKDPGKGTGLGLFIVRQIVEQNEGRISVRSAVGAGTTFVLEFPVAHRAAIAA